MTATPPVCNVEDCDRSGRITRGMCDMHYQRWKAHGHTDLLPKPERCSVDGCRRPARYAELCITHYGRWSHTGSTDPIRPPAEWINPLVCVCPEPAADPRRDFGMCQKCKRKPAALLRVPPVEDGAA